MSDITVAFWNLQNLFDTSVSRIASDLEFTPVHGWNREAFRAKVHNLARVIRSMFGGRGPDLLGICEIENRPVAEYLIRAIGRTDYRLAHVDSPDIRGIDTSLIYSNDVFELAAEPIEHLVHLRFPTRDLFEVPLRVRANGAELTVIVNHWPSRSRGLHETEAYRMTVASHCGRILDRILKFNRETYLRLPNRPATLEALNNRWNRNVLLMGDFNDEPFNRSILEVLQATKGVDHLEEPIKPSYGRMPSYKRYASKRAYVFNCMWSLMSKPDVGTHFYSGNTNTMNMLDQFMISRGLYFGLNGLRLETEADSNVPSVRILRDAAMTSRKGRPVAFKKENRSGFSDHFPILTTLRAA